jgi:hypothetical protein
MMPKFKVHAQRTQVQSQVFYVTAASREELEKKLQDVSFDEMDNVFDEGEVDSIDYEVVETCPCKSGPSTFASEELQEQLNNV